MRALTRDRATLPQIDYTAPRWAGSLQSGGRQPVLLPISAYLSVALTCALTTLIARYPPMRATAARWATRLKSRHQPRWGAHQVARRTLTKGGFHARYHTSSTDERQLHTCALAASRSRRHDLAPGWWPQR